MKLTSALATLLAAAAVAHLPASAEEFFGPGADACRSALPVFDGHIRSRPLAVQNEGTADAFVTCSQQTTYGRRFGVAGIQLVNTSDVPVTVSCTLVVGHVGMPASYSTRTNTVDAHFFTWIVHVPTPPATLFASEHLGYSCNLPPGVGVARISQGDVGAEPRPDAGRRR